GTEQRRKDETHQPANKRASVHYIRAHSQSSCDRSSTALGDIESSGRHPGTFVVSQGYPPYPELVERIPYALYEWLPLQILRFLKSDKRQIHAESGESLYGG